jgi:hypothetical protein
MPTFIKAGLWKKAKKALEGELNLTSLIQSLTPPPPPPPPEPTYKVYTAKISQTGTNAPVVDAVYENTLGGDVFFGYIITGEYAIESDNLFTGAGRAGDEDKVFVSISQGRNVAPLASFGISLLNDSNLILHSYNSTNGNPTNGILSGIYLEIRVYN